MNSLGGSCEIDSNNETIRGSCSNFAASKAGICYGKLVVRKRSAFRSISIYSLRGFSRLKSDCPSTIKTLDI